MTSPARKEQWGESSQPPWWQDPTKLTNEAVALAKDDLRRDLATQRELLAERIARLEGIIHDLDQRFSAEIGRRVHATNTLLALRSEFNSSVLLTVADDASVSADDHDALRQRLQTDIAIAIQNLKDVREEKFKAIQQQFLERDIRADQDKRASKDALDAALLAQKEAVAQQNDANTTAATKSETSFTKRRGCRHVCLGDHLDHLGDPRRGPAQVDGDASAASKHQRPVPLRAH